MIIYYQVRWPNRVPAGSVNMDIGSTMDIFTTILQLANVPVPKDRVIDGTSNDTLIQRFI